MKATIHPTFYSDAKVACRSCGTTFTTGSTRQSINVEVCSKCHPFFTGEHRFLDTKGRVEDFQRKQQAAKQFQDQNAQRRSKKDDKAQKQTKSLRELLSEA